MLSSSCWPWRGRVLRGSRIGVLEDGAGGVLQVHRIALEIHLGRPLLPGMEAVHYCGNRSCCNATHMVETDPAAPPPLPAVRRTQRRVTPAQAEEIRAARAAGESYASIARRYPISRSGARKIVVRTPAPEPPLTP